MKSSRERLSREKIRGTRMDLKIRTKEKPAEDGEEVPGDVREKASRLEILETKGNVPL